MGGKKMERGTRRVGRGGGSGGEKKDIHEQRKKTVQSQSSYRLFFSFKNIIRPPKHKIYSLTHPSMSSPVVLLSSYCCVTITTIHLKNCHFGNRKLFSYCTLTLHSSSQARASTLLFSTSIYLAVLARAVWCRNR